MRRRRDALFFYKALRLCVLRLALISISLNILSYTPLNYPIRNITIAINTRRLHNFEPQRKNKTAWAESPPPNRAVRSGCYWVGA